MSTLHTDLKMLYRFESEDELEEDKEVLEKKNEEELEEDEEELEEDEEELLIGLFLLQDRHGHPGV